MTPTDLAPTVLAVPGDERYSAVLFTERADAYRYIRLAGRIETEFPGLIKRWYAWSPKPSADRGPDRMQFVRNPARLGRRVISALESRWRLRGFGDVAKVEGELFGPEVDEFREKGLLPEVVAVPDSNSDEVISEVRDLAPYFVLTLGGPILRQELFEAARGFALNQHAGWSPDLKGSGTVYWALHGGRLDQVGATVHLLTTQVDGGPILRRGRPVLSADCTPAECFLRSVAVGSELMIDAIREILCSDTIRLFPQPKSGVTYRSRDLRAEHRYAIARNFRSGWLRQMLERQRQY